MVRWWMLVYCGCLGSPAELGGSWEFKSQLDPPPNPLGLLLMLSQLFDYSNKLPLWLWFFEAVAKVIKKNY